MRNPDELINDTPLITASVSSPWWMHYAAEFNVILTAVLTILGIGSVVIRIYKALYGKPE